MWSQKYAGALGVQVLMGGKPQASILQLFLDSRTR
jgi:hypothetical protein